MSVIVVIPRLRYSLAAVERRYLTALALALLYPP